MLTGACDVIEHVISYHDYNDIWQRVDVFVTLERLLSWNNVLQIIYHHFMIANKDYDIIRKIWNNLLTDLIKPSLWFIPVYFLFNAVDR